MLRFLIRGSGGHFTGWWTDGATIFWSGLLRLAETLSEALPFLIAGMLAAGVLRGVVGADRLQRILGVGQWTGPIRAWALGILLPVCALGALPVARELRRAGIPSGTVLSFVLVAPILNPVSVVYGISHVVATTLLYFVIGTFLISVGIGALWNRLISQRKDQPVRRLETAARSGSARLQVAGITACRGLVGPVFFDFALILITMGVLGAFLPYGVLQTAFTRDNALAPGIMAVVAIPVYITPMEVMMHFEHIVRDGYSLGAAFVLIVLGAGANVGVANWVRRDYGWRALAFLVLLLIGSTFFVAASADRSLRLGESVMKDHTHAFDSFTRLPSGQSYDARWLCSTVYSEMLPSQRGGLFLFGVMVGTGLLLWRKGERYSVERVLAQDASRKAAMRSGRLNVVLSPRTLVAIGAVMSLTFGLLLAYVYYPPPKIILTDVAEVRVELYEMLRAEDREECERRMHQLENLLGKIPVAHWLRRGGLSKEQRSLRMDLLQRLDVLHEFIEVDDFAAAKTLIPYVERAQLEFRKRVLISVSVSKPESEPQPVSDPSAMLQGDCTPFGAAVERRGASCKNFLNRIG